VLKSSFATLIDQIRPIAWKASDILMEYYARAGVQGDTSLKTTEKEPDDPVTAADLAVSD